MLDVISIGDGMITFDPISEGPLRFVNQFQRKIGGAELNVLIGCARLGMKAGWVSRLGNDEFGKHIFNMVRGEGVDVSEVQLLEEYPTSLNFKEIQANGNTRTFYYRHKSPTEQLFVEHISDDYLKQAKILHVTGVFPSILEKNRTLILEVMKRAKALGVKVSLDPNIRLKLWSKAEAKETLLRYFSYADYILAGLDELEILFGTNDLNVLAKVLGEYTFEQCVIKDGAQGAYYLKDGQFIHIPGFTVSKVVDTVGAGDGFGAGFLYSIIQGYQIERALHFAHAVGAMVVQVKGDNEGLPLLEDVQMFLGEKEFIER